MPSKSKRAVVDDRLLIEELLAGIPRDRSVVLQTTSYWYYRACRAAVLGAGGHLSGPFQELSADEQEQAILSLLELRGDIGLPDPRPTIPRMAQIAKRHPQLNLLNLEAVAVGQLTAAQVWLSAETANGLLPAVLDQEGVGWQVIAISQD